MIGTGSSVELPHAIEEAIEDSAGLAGSRPVALIAEYPAHLPAVEGDQEMLARVVLALIESAVGRTRQGEVRIRASVIPAGEAPEVFGGEKVGGTPPADGGPWALVTVSDNGPSLSAKDLVSLLESGAVGQALGSRLTLSECKQIVEGYGGHLWAESQAEHGTQFGFALPLRAAHHSGSGIASLRKLVETRLPEGGLATKTLLLVVEDPGLRSMFSRELAEAGYRVVVSESGGDALDLTRGERPDLVLLDLEARDPTAFDIAMVLKQDREARNTPVLFLTSVDDPQVGTRMGTVDFVVRPTGTGKLLAAINALLVSGLKPFSRVLIVEPDAVNREAMFVTIQSHGYRVTEATGSEEALVLAERLNPGLALVNARLAQERDYWLLREMRRASAELEIFVLADVLSEAEGQAAIRRGASGFSETGKLPDLLNKVKGRQGKEGG